LNMPQAWENAPAYWSDISGSWGQPGTWGTHRVCAGRYEPLGLYVITWGQERHITWGAMARHGLHSQATVSRSWLDAAGISPAGLDIAALEREARALAA